MSTAERPVPEPSLYRAGVGRHRDQIADAGLVHVIRPLLNGRIEVGAMADLVGAVVVQHHPGFCAAARALKWLTGGAGDICAVAHIRSAERPCVCRAQAVLLHQQFGWSFGLVDSGESLLRNSSCCAARVPAWKKEEGGFERRCSPGG